jgi:hypothetical protein
MACSQQLEVTEGDHKMAEYGLVRTDNLYTAHAAWTAMPQRAIGHGLRVTAHWHEAHRPWPRMQGEATACNDQTISGTGALSHTTM